MKEKGQVTWLVEYNTSKAAERRFQKALATAGVPLDRVSYDYVMLAYHTTFVWMTPAEAAKFTEVMGAKRGSSVKYASPTFFDYGSISPVYASPEDELADRKSPAYERFVDETEFYKFTQ